MKAIIIGIVAGGASSAARRRRLDENAEIIVVFGVDMRLGCEAMKIWPEKKTVELRNVEAGDAPRRFLADRRDIARHYRQVSDCDDAGPTVDRHARRGRDPGVRNVQGLGTAQRNVSAAFS